MDGLTPRYAFSPALFLGFFCLIWLFGYPGRLNIDALEMFVGAAFPEFRNDWHSPIIGWLWNLTGDLLGRPASALLVHSLLLSLGCAVIPVGQHWNGWTIAAGMLEVVWKAALIGIAGTTSKDTLLIGLLVAALAAYRLWLCHPSRVWLAAIFVFIFLVVAARPPNVVMLWVAAALTLLFYVEGIKRYLSSLLLIGLALIGCVCIVAAANRYLLHARPAHPEVQLAIFDVAGTSVYSGTDLFRNLPEKPPQQLPDIRSCYKPKWWDEFAPWGSCRAYSAAVYAAGGRAGGTRLARWYLESVLTNPQAYATHRVAFLKEALIPTISMFVGYGPDWYLDFGQPINSPHRRAVLERAAHSRVSSDWFQKWHPTTIPRPVAILTSEVITRRRNVGVALIVCVALLGASLRSTRSSSAVGKVTVLAAGLGIGNFVMMGFFGAADSPRYFYPLVLAAYIGLTEWLRLKGGQIEGVAALTLPSQSRRVPSSD